MGENIVVFTCPDEAGKLPEWKQKAVDALSAEYSREALLIDDNIRAAAREALERGDGFMYDAVKQAISKEFTFIACAAKDEKGKNVEVSVNLLDRTIRFGKRIK